MAGLRGFMSEIVTWWHLLVSAGILCNNECCDCPIITQTVPPIDFRCCACVTWNSPALFTELFLVARRQRACYPHGGVLQRLPRRGDPREVVEKAVLRLRISFLQL